MTYNRRRLPYGIDLMSVNGHTCGIETLRMTVCTDCLYRLFVSPHTFKMCTHGIS